MILAVSGGKGGVGKSTVSLNLARELDAVVVDADLATPDLPSGRGPDLHDVLAGRATPTDAVERIGSVLVLPCGRTLAGARASDLATLRRTVETLDRQYGRVVVDCPAGLARDVGVQLHSADVAVLVTMPERAALLDAYRTRHLAHEVGTPIASVVLNRGTRPQHEALAERVEETFGTPTTILERRAAVAAANARGKPVRDVEPDSPAVDVLSTLARSVERCDRRRLERADPTPE
ncbi:MinD/ParA family ATP-binding protein [Halomontanus rarus]|uniref:MinD/ParA family ATP-binding protein n=1 Tax=Halomontanus rarus TaxID=3034020 RepID=UPI001A9973F2|nr:P-loop NTPase [Halovivax sp. TS33]